MELGASEWIEDLAEAKWSDKRINPKKEDIQRNRALGAKAQRALFNLEKIKAKTGQTKILLALLPPSPVF